ncbi:MAG TPA: glycosyltransferase family 4 protein [Planctomycetota bacterium]|nr:glycosyltransferase family 4 protein [Planctomycetota bacterium]
MRVLITSPVFPPDLGGPAVYVPNFARWLVERGHQVTVVAFCSDPEPKGWPFRVVSIPPASLPARYLKAMFAVRREARAADVVFVNEHLALLHVFGARLARKPVVIRIMVDGAWEISHRYGWCDGDDIVTFQSKPYGWKVALTRALQRRWWRASAHVIACSDFLRQILIRTYGVPEGKVERVYNAYHGPAPDAVKETPAEARRKLGLPEGPRYLLTICRLMVWKRVDAIIEALTRLPDDVQLLVAGDGDMLDAWKALAARLGLAERVRFLGNVPHESIPLLIRASEIFVLNSEYEGLSHTLIEVQTLGTPIVASRVCGNPEVVADGETGFLVDPRDLAGLVRAIATLLEDPALRERFAREGQRTARRFLRDATFPKVLAALEHAAVGIRP